MFKHKIRKKVALTILLGFVVAPELDAMHVAALKVCAWVLKAQAIRYIARAIPGVGAAYLAKNLYDIGSGCLPQLELSDSAIEALKQSQVFQHVQQSHVGVTHVTSPMSNFVQQALGDLCAASSAPSLSLPSAFQSLSGSVQSSMLMPTNVDWRAGVSASSQLKHSFFQSMEQPKGLLSLSTQINGQTQLVREGTSPLGVRLVIDTGSDTSWGAIASKTFQDQLHQIRLQQTALHEVPQLQQMAVKPIEKVLQNIINSEHVSVVDAVKMMQKLDTCIAQSAQIVQQKIDACNVHQFHPELLQGVQGVHADLCRTVQYIKGALCDASGNIIGLQSHMQRELLAQVYGHHCACQGFDAEAIAQRMHALQNQSLHEHFAQHSFKVNGLQDTLFNRDLLRAINYIEHGYATHAQALIDAYNPENFGRISNWWYNRHQLYQVAQDAYASAYKAAYTSEGIFKPFTQHPLWEELHAVMQREPSLASQIMRKLQNEYAFSLQTLNRLHVMQPTDAQLSQMFELCQYGYLHDFEKSVQALTGLQDVTSFIETCAKKHTFFESLRVSSECSEAFWPYVLQHQELLSQVAHDPQLHNLIGSIESLHDVGDAIHVLQERLKASNALLQQCGAESSHVLSRTLSYHLVDNFHDPHKMLAILTELDPQHAQHIVREAYHDFFDEQGVQKLLPIDDGVRALFQKKLGESFSFNDNAQLRDAFNKLAAITPRNEQDVAIIQKGFSLFEQALSTNAHAPLFAEYVPQFVDALTNGTDAQQGVLSWANMFDAYQHIPDPELKKIYGDLLQACLHNQAGVAGIATGLQTLEQSVHQIQNGDYSALRSILSHAKIEQMSLPTLPDVLSQRVTEPSIPISSMRDGAKAAQQKMGLQDILTDAAKATALQHVARHGFPGLPVTRAASSSPAMHSQSETHEQLKKRMLLDWALRDRAEREMLGDTKGKGKSRFGMSRALLERGEIVAQTEEGILVRDDDMFAHVYKDGSVDTLHPQYPDAFAQEVRKTAKEYTAKASSSSSDGAYQSFDDWLNAQKKRHANRAGSQSAKTKTAPSCSGGGAPPPNDPRNRRGQQQGGGRDRDIMRVDNMDEFFKTEFGKTLKGKVRKTSIRYHGQSAYQVTEKVAHTELKKGCYVYLDAKHKDHLEVFSANRQFKTVLNLDGTVNAVKRVSGKGRKL